GKRWNKPSAVRDARRSPLALFRNNLRRPKANLSNICKLPAPLIDIGHSGRHKLKITLQQALAGMVFFTPAPGPSREYPTFSQGEP
ncbi:MAG: hypothetical protein IKT16_01755, partial [Desulfovibrio sp.]|nr:hypothetical protein [Desulfovibrio sp.]